MAYELIARTSVCMNYVIGTTKPLLVVELEAARKDLKTTKKENVKLSYRLEKVEKTAEDDQEKAATALTKAQNANRLLKRSNDTLKLDLQKASTQNKVLVKERDSLIAARDKLAFEN